MFKVGDILIYVIQPERRYIVTEVDGETIALKGINGGMTLYQSKYHVFKFYRVLTPLEKLL